MILPRRARELPGAAPSGAVKIVSGMRLLFSTDGNAFSGKMESMVCMGERDL